MAREVGRREGGVAVGGWAGGQVGRLLAHGKELLRAGNMAAVKGAPLEECGAGGGGELSHKIIFRKERKFENTFYFSSSYLSYSRHLYIYLYVGGKAY